MTVLDVLGWTSSILVVWSLMVARVMRFRVLNLAGAALATGVNAAIGLWPFVAMNGAIAIIDVYWIWRLQGERHDVRAYEVVEVGIDDAYLRHLLSVKAEDLRATHPSFRLPPAGEGAASGRSAFLVLHGDETVGMVVVRDVGQAVGEVELDYVTERFRDFTPGEFVYRRSGVFPAKGLRTLRLADDIPAERRYYEQVGFRLVDGRWERPAQVAQA